MSGGSALEVLYILLSQMQPFTQSHPMFLRSKLIFFPLLRLDSYLLLIHIFLSKIMQVLNILILEGPCVIFCNIYTFQRDTQCSNTDCLLMHRCQLYMFRTVRVHPQTLYQRDVSDSAVLTTYHNLHIQHLKRSS